MCQPAAYSSTTGSSGACSQNTLSLSSASSACRTPSYFSAPARWFRHLSLRLSACMLQYYLSVCAEFIIFRFRHSPSLQSQEQDRVPYATVCLVSSSGPLSGLKQKPAHLGVQSVLLRHVVFYSGLRTFGTCTLTLCSRSLCSSLCAAWLCFPWSLCSRSCCSTAAMLQWFLGK